MSTLNARSYWSTTSKDLSASEGNSGWRIKAQRGGVRPFSYQKSNSFHTHQGISQAQRGVHVETLTGVHVDEYQLNSRSQRSRRQPVNDGLSLHLETTIKDDDMHLTTSGRDQDIEVDDQESQLADTKLPIVDEETGDMDDALPKRKSADDSRPNTPSHTPRLVSVGRRDGFNDVDWTNRR